MRIAANSQYILKVIGNAKLQMIIYDLLYQINDLKDFVRNKSIEFSNPRVVVMTKAKIVNKCKIGYNINEV